MKTKFICCLITIILLSVYCDIASAQTQTVDSLKQIYRQKIIDTNLGHWVQFLSDSVNTDSISRKKQILELVSTDIKITSAVSIPFYIMKDCNSFGISANVFFIEYEGELKQKKGEGEFFPNKATLTYKWKKLSDNLLFFVYLGRELGSPLQNYIYIP